MIQRKQSIWLLLAALLNAGVFLFASYRYDIVNGEMTDHKQLLVTDHYPSLLVALVITLLPLLTIFMFRNRKQQMRMAIYCIVSVASYVTLMLTRVSHLEKSTPAPVNGSYWIGAVLPVLSAIFLIMAFAGIRRDEKLVRSVDRLR